MKKLISAVASIATAASAMAAVMPASISALEESKTLYLSTITDTYHADKNEVTLTAADLKDGPVTLKCGLFLDSSTVAEINCIQARFGCTSAPAGGMDSVSLAIPSGANGNDILKPYFTTDQTYTKLDGTKFTTKNLPFFVAEYDEDFGDYTAYGNMAASCPDSVSFKSGEKIENQSVSLVWGNAYGDNVWLGATSDEFPAYYFDVTIDSDAVSGDYVFDFYDFFTDEAGNLPCTYVGSVENFWYNTAKIKATLGGSLLNLEPMTIHVENGAEPTTPEPTTETPTANPNPGTGAVFSYEKDVYEVQPGDKVMMKMYLDTNGELISGVQVDIAFAEELRSSITKVNANCASLGATFVTNYYDSYVAAGNDPALFYAHDAAQTPMAITANAPIGTLNADNTYTSVASTNDAIFFAFQIEIPADIKDGDYAISLPYAYVAGNKTSGKNDVAVPELAHSGGDTIIRVGNAETTTAEPTTAAPTTAPPTTAPPTTVPPTTVPPTTGTPGTRILGDANCNGEVNVADVVVLNKYLAGVEGATLEDQGKINAEVDNPTTDVTKVDLTYKDSQYIIKSVIGLYDLTDDGPVATGDKGTTEIK